MEAFLTGGFWLTLDINSDATQISLTLNNSSTNTITGIKNTGSFVGLPVKFGSNVLCDLPMYFSGFTIIPSRSYADDFTTDTVSEVLGAFSTPSGSVEVANEYVSRYTGV